MKAAVVGMGVMGRVLALALHNAGWKVTLYDHNSGDSNCSFAAAGLLTPFSEWEADSIVFRLGQESTQSGWGHIVQQISSEHCFKQNGTMILCHPHDKAEWNRLGGRTSSYQSLRNQALLELEPELSKFETAYFFPQEAHLDCQTFMPLLKNYLESQGISCLLNTPVLSLEPGRILHQSGVQTFDMVFDCRGLGAQPVFKDLRAVRGELIWLHAPEVQLHRPIRLLHPRYALYIVPRPGNIYLIGASEVEAHDLSPISLRSALELLTAAYYVHAGFAEARILKTVTHCRPTLANHVPRILYKNGLMAINGLYRHGYLIAPALAQEILGYLEHNRMQYPQIWRTQND